MKQIVSVILFTLTLFGVILGTYAYVVRKDAPLVLPPSGSTGTTSKYTIIAFGDSLTAGYGVSQSESYPAQLEARLRGEKIDARVINAGVSGETTKGNLERATFIRKQNPQIVILGIGGNDALRYLPIEETVQNMRATIEILRDGDNPPLVLLLQMQAPLNAGFSYKQKFDALYAALSDEYDIPLVPFLTKLIFLNPAYKLNDGIHYNRDGYAKVIDEYLLEAVTDALSSL